MNDREELVAAAVASMELAYAPYSKFRVGTALRAESGRLYTGCNVENAAYPEGICSEASAIAAMVMGGDSSIKEIAVAGIGEPLVTPCGGCRQKIREFAAPDALVHICGPNGIRASMTVAELLPVSFGPENLP